MTPQIPGYKIVRTLGKGGMATVFLAVQDIFERPVALKVMAQGLSEDPTFSQRFFREARIVSQLVHPNIVTVFDVGVHEGAFYLSMEYIEGQDLKQARKQLNLQQKIQAVQDIARALEFAAQKGYVHRDIKPENIMIAKADQRAVLMDFGIARAAETDLSVTQTGLAIGTPHYMSPEQAKGKAVDARSDLYSLGVVFYLLLTGKVPFDGDSAVAIGIKHITEMVPDLPESMAAAQPIVSRLMAKAPQDRYQRPEELVEALEHLKSQMLDAPEVIESDVLSPELASQATIVEPSLGSEPNSLQFTSVEPARKDAKASESGGLSWFAVGAILTVAAIVAGFTVRYFFNKPQPQDSFAALTATGGTNTKTAGSAENSVAQIRANIALMTKAYQKSESQLPVLVKLYRDLQKLQPNDEKIEQELNALAEQLLKRLTWALNLADYDQAVLLNKNLRMLFPEYVSDELARQEARLNSRDQIKLFLSNAEDYANRGALTTPAGANAQEMYESALALDPEITPAKEALAKIRQQPVANVPQKITVTTPAKTAAENLAQARLLADAGQLFAPTGRNAYEVYAQILSKDPGNPEARQAVNALWQSLPALADKWVKEGAYSKANEQLAAAALIKPKDKNLIALRQSIDEKIVERNRNKLPHVADIRVAGFPIESFDEPQAQSLSVSKSLHLRIQVEHVEQQKLYINVYEGARYNLVQQAQFDGRNGLALLKIEPPSGGFKPGAYTLDITADGQIVETQRFRID